MPTTLTGNSPEREQRLQALLLDRISLKYERRIAREIAREMNQAADAVKNGVSPAMLSTADHQQNMGRILTSLWTDSVEMMANHLLQGVKAAPGPLHKKENGRIVTTAIIDNIMREWALSIGSQKITQISETTRSDIRRIVEAGIAAGESEKEIADKIWAVSPTKSMSRAQTISRTESHAAANAATQASAKAVNVPMRRRWASASARVRDTHDRADGQTVGMDEPFIVGGHKLRYPGDPRGPAEEVINCRCAVVFVIE
jgi:uncharacterized protein with gpF-like domain